MDIEDKNKNIFPVRCAFKRLSRSDGKLYRCNSLCVRVSSDSFGEARCRKCRLSFDYTVDAEGVVRPFVTVKPVKETL